MRHCFGEPSLLTMLENSHERRSTYGSNSWMTLSNLKTEKSLVEKAEEGRKGTWINAFSVYIALGRQRIVYRKGWTHRGQQPWTG